MYYPPPIKMSSDSYYLAGVDKIWTTISGFGLTILFNYICKQEAVHHDNYAEGSDYAAAGTRMHVVRIHAPSL